MAWRWPPAKNRRDANLGLCAAGASGESHSSLFSHLPPVVGVNHDCCAVVATDSGYLFWRDDVISKIFNRARKQDDANKYGGD